MPFNQLQSAQQLEVCVAGPADANRLFICSGLAVGNYSLLVPGNSSDGSDETWQFEVGPKLAVNQFRGATGGASLAGVSETNVQSVSWAIQGVTADFDSQSGLIRVGVTQTMAASNSTAGAYAVSGIATIAYSVSILAVMPAGT
jgi:hypothetical protein